MPFTKGHPFYGDLSKPNYFKKGEHNGVEFKKGAKKSSKWKEAMSERVGDKHKLWKGDRVGYYALHAWVVRKLGKPDACERCKESGFVGKQIHWANKDHTYKRNMTDWVRLCFKCHREYDIENNNLLDKDYVTGKRKFA